MMTTRLEQLRLAGNQPVGEPTYALTEPGRQLIQRVIERVKEISSPMDKPSPVFGFDHFAACETNTRDPEPGLTTERVLSQTIQCGHSGCFHYSEFVRRHTKQEVLELLSAVLAEK